MDAGKLDKHITIQQCDKTARDSYGEPTGDWTPVCRAWANITAIGYREFWQAQAAHAEVTHRVTIRYRSGITADMRVLYGSRILDIVAPPVDIDEAHEWLILKCREVTT